MGADGHKLLLRFTHRIMATAGAGARPGKHYVGGTHLRQWREAHAAAGELPSTTYNTNWQLLLVAGNWGGKMTVWRRVGALWYGSCRLRVRPSDDTLLLTSTLQGHASRLPPPPTLTPTAQPDTHRQILTTSLIRTYTINSCSEEVYETFKQQNTYNSFTLW